MVNQFIGGCDDWLEPFVSVSVVGDWWVGGFIVVGDGLHVSVIY